MKLNIILLFTCLIVTSVFGERDDDRDNSTQILSRVKRYLVFPDGSSFQLVFCTQNHGYLQVGNIVWLGNTAALAWELPSDPKIFSIFKNDKDLGVYGQRRQDHNQHIYYMDEDGKVIKKIPYKRKFSVNPAFAKRSVDSQEKKQVLSRELIKEMHATQKSRNFLQNIEEKYREFHREGRNSLYVKIEKLLEGLGWRGKECVLRMLCEAGKGRKEQGTFLEEIMRATFTLPRSENHCSKQNTEYDVAHGSNGDCAALYPECEDLHGLLLYQQ